MEGSPRPFDCLFLEGSAGGDCAKHEMWRANSREKGEECLSGNKGTKTEDKAENGVGEGAMKVLFTKESLRRNHCGEKYVENRRDILIQEHGNKYKRQRYRQRFRVEKFWRSV